MKTQLISALSLLGVSAVASAQSESTTFDHHVAQVRDAFEVGVATGYAQGGGKLGGGMSDLQDVTGPGGALELDLGYRILPELSIGAYGTLSTFDTGTAIDNSTDLLGATAGIQAAYHFRADRSIDPWLSLGTGWKGLWLDPPTGKTTSLQGLELARLQVGVDYRVSEDVSIAPVIGGSLAMFVSEDSPMTASYDEIQNKEVHLVGFAGLSGRFDFGGTR